MGGGGGQPTGAAGPGAGEMRDGLRPSVAIVGARDERGTIGLVADVFVEIPGDQDLGGAERPPAKPG